MWPIKPEMAVASLGFHFLVEFFNGIQDRLQTKHDLTNMEALRTGRG